MCNEDTYIEFPAITLGGGTGNYFATCPTVSCQWAEWAIDTVTNGDGGTGAILISANYMPTVGLDYTGLAANKMSDGAILHAVPIRLPATATQYVNSSYERITNSEKKVWVRIDAAASTSMFVTIRFRIKKLAVVPGPSHEVHPDHMHKLNQARAETTTQRLKEAGVPGYADETSGFHTNKGQ